MPACRRISVSNGVRYRALSAIDIEMLRRRPFGLAQKSVQVVESITSTVMLRGADACPRVDGPRPLDPPGIVYWGSLGEAVARGAKSRHDRHTPTALRVTGVCGTRHNDLDGPLSTVSQGQCQAERARMRDVDEPRPLDPDGIAY